MLWVDQTHTSHTRSHVCVDKQLNDGSVKARCLRQETNCDHKNIPQSDASAQSLIGLQRRPQSLQGSIASASPDKLVAGALAAVGSKDEQPLTIICYPGKPVAGRAMNLMKSEIKSHAAKAHHARTKAERDSSNSTGKRCPSPHSGVDIVDSLLLTRVSGNEEAASAYRNVVHTAGKPHSHHTLPEIPPTLTLHIGNTKKDPFDVFPINLSDREHYLLDNYLRVFVPSFYNVPSRHQLVFNYFRDVSFSLAMTHPATFRCGVLGLAASMRAHQSMDKETEQDLEYQNTQSLISTREFFSSSNNYASDVAIAICLFRAIFDKFHPDVTSNYASLVHMRMAKQMVRERGGFRAFMTNPRLLVLYYLCNYRTLGYDCRPYGWLRALDSSDFMSAYESQIEEGTNQLCTEFMLFLQKVEEVCTIQLLTAPTSLYRIMFNEGSLLHTIMTSAHNATKEDSSSDSSSIPSGRHSTSSSDQTPAARHHIDTYGRIVLLYLYMVLWDLRDSPLQRDHFLRNLNSTMLKARLDRCPSIEALDQLICCSSALQSTGTDSNDEEHARERHFQMLDSMECILTAAKRLSPASWTTLWDILINGLTFRRSTEITTSTHHTRTPGMLTAHEKDNMRREILHAPLWCQIAPAFAIPVT